ncbi:MAG: transporter related [Frankiales bacterium]|nr:transporter related [Frankiales bacterium]
MTAAALALPAEPVEVDALQVDALEVRFGGVRAVDGVHLTVGPQETVGLIGTNGAGKTTLMDCVSGYCLPSGGTLRLFGTEVSRTPPELRPYLGLGRSFQDARLFPAMTVTETLLVAVERHLPTGLLAGLLGLGSRQERAKREAVGELVEMTGLTRYADTRTGELSTGTRRVVDLTCILAQRPRLLLLDEPTAGVAQRETEAFGPLLRRIKAQLGCAVLLIEHDMPLITNLSDRIYAMESGRVIAEGPPDVVMRDPRVVASYLGTTEEAINRSNQPGAGPSAPPLAGLSRAQLLVLAAGRALPGRSRMSREQLVRALS